MRYDHCRLEEGRYPKRQLYGGAAFAPDYQTLAWSPFTLVIANQMARVYFPNRDTIFTDPETGCEYDDRFQQLIRISTLLYQFSNGGWILVISDTAFWIPSVFSSPVIVHCSRSIAHARGSCLYNIRFSLDWIYNGFFAVVTIASHIFAMSLSLPYVSSRY